MALLSRISSRASGKLRGADNYYEWQSEMRLRLQLAGLYGLIDGSSKKPEPLHLSSHASEKVCLMARQREEQIQKHRRKRTQCLFKILRMCAPDVRREILDEDLQIHPESPLAPWQPGNLWAHLERLYSKPTWSSKWALVKRFDEINLNHPNTLGNSKKSKQVFANIWTETRDMKLTADDIFKMHAIDIVAKNSPRVAMLLREKARTEEALPDCTEIFRLMDVYLGERRFDSAIDTASDMDSSNGTKRYDSNENNVEKISGKHYYCNENRKNKNHSEEDCFNLHPQEAPEWWHRRMEEWHDKALEKGERETSDIRNTSKTVVGPVAVKENAPDGAPSINARLFELSDKWAKN